MRSVGITQHESAYGIRVVRNSAEPVPFHAGAPQLTSIEGVPLVFTDTFGEVETLILVPGTGPGSPSASTVVPEVNRYPQIVCGLQIQNFDNDYRQGEISRGYIVIGTLGCMVRLETGQIALLSNNHVIAGENKGLKSQDRILQPGSLHHNSTDQIATLSDFIDLQVSQPGATPRKGGILYNEIDAGLAQLDPSIQLTQGYLPFRKLISPGSSASAKLGDQVFKVGRTTGLTYGTVIDIATIVGPIPYPSGACWFRDSIVVEGLNGTQFSDKGDSGSAILRTNGEVIGILYAGNGQQTYVCPIDTVLNELKCKIA